MSLLDRVRRSSTALSVAILALLAVVPSTTAAPGRMPADSKLYLYLDPGRFLADTTTTFDARQFAGWVPHQHIAYLWPTGPWFWVFETLGVPDWIAHRLWIATLLCAAGLGVRWMLRLLGFGPLPALVAAIAYQLSPYVLAYVSRTSVLLLPFAGLGWIVGCTILATRRGRWRHPAFIALIVLTVGAVNATALAMIVPAPALWLLHAGWSRSAPWRRIAGVAAKTTLLATGVSLWWIAMLVIQARHGADVLAYSESLESVSFTSTSTEVSRGLGYWLFYVRDAFAATTTASIDHLVSVRTILAGFAVTAIGLAGIAFVRSPHRRFAGLLVGAGVVIAVGVHPIDDPAPLVGQLLGDRDGGLALALRSSTRAVPVLLIGLSIGVASVVSVAGDVARRLTAPAPALARLGAAGLVGAVTIVGLPALWTGGFVDPALERDQRPPRHWLDAAAALDALPAGYRVLQVPGSEFGAFEWGYTVDQPLPGLTDRPLVTRDLLPLGAAAAMDLVFALDDRIQEGTLEPASVAPVARLLGVDTVWVAGDVTFERFGLARPEVVTGDLLDAVAAGGSALSAVTTYGRSAPVVPAVPVFDAETLADPRVGAPIAPITLLSVDDPVPTVRVKDATVRLAGSGDGLVDAAAAGLIDGNEAIVYAATEPTIEVPVDRVVLTDSNRRRAHHWRSSQDVEGYTEEAGGGVLRDEPADQRLPVFPDGDDAGEQTVSRQDGTVTARASAYGEPFAYRPEHRAVMAIDGDLSTSWVVADRAPAVGEFIELRVAGGLDHLDLRQPDTAPGARTISEVVVTVDGEARPAVTLDERSLVGDGQRIELGDAGSPGSAESEAAVTVRVEIAATSDPQPAIADAIGAVGFAEIGTGHEPTTEWIVPPTLPEVDADTPIDVVFTRLRTEPTDRWRDDPEPVLRREFDLPRPVDAETEVTIRFDRRDGVPVSGETVADDGRLTGAPRFRGSAAFDRDGVTAWITPFVDVVGRTVRIAEPGLGTATTMTVRQLAGEQFSPVTVLRLDDGAGDPFEVPVGDGAIALPRPVDVGALSITIAAIDARTTLDRRYAEPFALPAAIVEITFDGPAPTVSPLTRVRADCRTDLLTIDGEPVGLSFDVDPRALLDGDPFEATVCGDPGSLPAGTHRIESTPGDLTGFQVDRVTFSESGVSSRPEETPGSGRTGRVDPTSTVLVESSARSRTVDVPACPEGCWAIVGEGFNEAWSAESEGRDLGEPTLIDGNANGWWIAPTTEPTRVEVRWTAQRPLNVAFAVSALTALVALALVARDRRRPSDHVPSGLPIEPIGLRVRSDTSAVPDGTADLGAAVVTAMAAAVLVDWIWGAAAAVVWAVGILVRRPQIVGWVGWVVTTTTPLVVTAVVLRERPFPDAGWPVRFEYLHPWTLFGVVLLSGAALAGHRRATATRPEPVVAPPDSEST